MANTKKNDAYRFNLYCRKGKVLDETIENFLKNCPDAQDFVKEVLFEKITGKKYNVMDYMCGNLNIPKETKNNDTIPKETFRNENKPLETNSNNDIPKETTKHIKETKSIVDEDSAKKEAFRLKQEEMKKKSMSGLAYFNKK